MGFAPLVMSQVMPLSGDGKAQYQPIWADDVARCITRVLSAKPENRNYDLTGPEILTHEEIVKLVLKALSEKGIADMQELDVEPLAMSAVLNA